MENVPQASVTDRIGLIGCVAALTAYLLCSRAVPIFCDELVRLVQKL